MLFLTFFGAVLITLFQNIISYVFPLTLEKRKGELTSQLEITIENGRYVLNTRQVNYSFGGLHKVFEKVFKKEKIEKLNIKNVLVLGFGAGDVAELLVEKYKFNCTIIGIEKDPIVIELAKKYFNINRFNNLKLVHDDAFHFVQTCNQTFDLIVIDIFIEDKIPKIFDQELFLNHIKRIKAREGILFYNRPFNDEVACNLTLELAGKMNEVIGNTSMNIIRSYGLKNCVLVHRY